MAKLGEARSIACHTGPDLGEARASVPQWLRRLWVTIMEMLMVVCLFNGRSETGTYDSESELTEAGLNDTDGPTPRPHHDRHQPQQQQRSRGVPLGTDNRHDDISDWDESVRSVI